MTVLDRVPVDRITVEAQELELGRKLLALVLGVFYAVGWLAGRVVLAVVWLLRKVAFALSNVTAAVKIGYRDARKLDAARGQPS
ncbi:hypothetical protein [Streptomyces sp.]|uniref:hypothetical protein n=1 Tax=Streptomyces sp. TaxID=1931 RepID=UPI002F939B0B